MPMNPRLLRPLATGFLKDADARAYIAAVEQADAQRLEKQVALAIEAFIVGCKADGIWTALKASCILMGARTLSGALTPLVGTAPTNNGPFVSGDYNRETGLLGNGSTKYLNSNRNNNADPQNSQHMLAYVSAAPTTGAIFAAGAGATAGRNAISVFGGNYFSRSRNASGNSFGATSATGVVGLSRAASATYTERRAGATTTASLTSETPLNENIGVFARSTGELHTDARIAFYSIGEALTLATLDTRVTALYNAIGAAI